MGIEITHLSIKITHLGEKKKLYASSEYIWGWNLRDKKLINHTGVKITYLRKLFIIGSNF